MSISIRALAETDSVAELTELLHAAYAPLGQMGLNYTAVDQSADVTRSRIAGGECYVAVDGDMLIGTVLFRRHSGGCFWYEQAYVATIHQFAVLPGRQRHGIGLRLMDYVQSRAKALGAAEIALDTAEGATHLVEWYIRQGYRQVAIEQWRGKTYRSLILSKRLTA